VIVRDDNGQPTGVFTDNAMALVADSVPAPTTEQMNTAIASVVKEAAELGVTGVTDMGSPDEWIDGPLYAWAMAGNLTLRLEVLRLAVDTEMGPGSDPATAQTYHAVGPTATLSSKGVKFFLDGA
jgi:predicted amidohydrolase YtcJ